MKNYILGTILGIVIATVGFSGVAKVLDKVVSVTKEQAAKAVKE